jgi:hypothetical protein
MSIQLTRKRIVNTLLIGTLVLGIGSLNTQPAAAQLSRSAFREMARELNLSRSQMQATAGIMREFKSEIEGILTPEQVEVMQSARGQRQSQSQIQDPQQLQEALNLTGTQSAQLAAAREEMVMELQAILAPYQLEGIMEMTGFSQL